MVSKDDKQSQSERFKQTARDLGVELDEDKLKEALRRMKEPQPKDGKKAPKQD